MSAIASKPTKSPLIARALAAARETRGLEIGRGLLDEVPSIFAAQFGSRPAAIVADTNTFAAAGRKVVDAFKARGHSVLEPFVFEDADLYAEHSFVARSQDWLATHDGVPVAVGSGSINDITKLAAHRTKRQYLAVATAASMDGYTAFGASITHDGSKQTFDCPAPQAVVADLDVIAAAPPAMNASGYADLLAKVTAGADWVLADALGVEAIDPTAWELVQVHLRRWLSDPAGVRRGDVGAIAGLVEGLMMGGFAMQWTRSSRCASGAEHQFSHLWDMEHHTHDGVVPSHGFKVGVATHAITRLYEVLLALDLDDLDPQELTGLWPNWPEQEQRIRSLFPIPELANKAVEESRAKYLDHDAMRTHLEQVRERWPLAQRRLREQLVPANELADMLAAAGAPVRPGEIGISTRRLRDSHRLAYHIRRRYTVLDLAVRADLLDDAMAGLYPD